MSERRKITDEGIDDPWLIPDQQIPIEAIQRGPRPPVEWAKQERKRAFFSELQHVVSAASQPYFSPDKKFLAFACPNLLSLRLSANDAGYRARPYTSEKFPDCESLFIPSRETEPILVAAGQSGPLKEMRSAFKRADMPNRILLDYKRNEVVFFCYF